MQQNKRENIGKHAYLEKNTCGAKKYLNKIMHIFFMHMPYLIVFYSGFFVLEQECHMTFCVCLFPWAINTCSVTVLLLLFLLVVVIVVLFFSPLLSVSYYLFRGETPKSEEGRRREHVKGWKSNSLFPREKGFYWQNPFFIAEHVSYIFSLSSQLWKTHTRKRRKPVACLYK